MYLVTCMLWEWRNVTTCWCYWPLATRWLRRSVMLSSRWWWEDSRFVGVSFGKVVCTNGPVAWIRVCMKYNVFLDLVQENIIRHGYCIENIISKMWISQHHVWLLDLCRCGIYLLFDKSNLAVIMSLEYLDWQKQYCNTYPPTLCKCWRFQINESNLWSKGHNSFGKNKNICWLLMYSDFSVWLAFDVSISL